MNGVIKYCKEHRPKVLVAENVVGILAHNKVNGFMRKMAKAGYVGEFKKLCTSQCFFPQTRRRVWFVFVHESIVPPVRPDSIMQTVQELVPKKHLGIRKVIGHCTPGLNESAAPDTTKLGTKWVADCDARATKLGLAALASQEARESALSRSWVGELPLRPRAKHVLLLEVEVTRG